MITFGNFLVMFLFWPNVYFNTAPRIWRKQNNNYVFLSICHFSDDNDKLLTIERWQGNCIIWMNLIHDTTRNDKTNFHQEWRLSHHWSLSRQKSQASSVPGLREIVSRKIRSIVSQIHKPSVTPVPLEIQQSKKRPPSISK